MQQHDLSEFELEREGLKLRVRKTSTGFTTTPVPQQLPAPYGNARAGAGSAGVPRPRRRTRRRPKRTALELAVVKSPIVGTFYRSPEPGAPRSSRWATRVKKDQVLCIIEAMKLMNEIKSEYDGRGDVNVYVENGKPVQYGERLFAIKTT